MIKAAFFDVDNTMYNWKAHSFEESGIKAIKALKKKGVKVFLCSSRPYDSMKRFGCFNLGIKWDGWIGSTGGIASTEGKIIYKELMDPKDVKSIIKVSKENGLMMEVVTPHGRFITDEKNDYCFGFEEDYEEPWCPISDYKGGQCTGLLLFCPEAFDDKLKEAAPNVIFDRFHAYALDIMPAKHSKGNGVKAIIEYYGYSKDEAIGFGDDIQDIGMTEALTHFVSMGNGKEEVKKAAEFVTGPINEKGIYLGLKHYGLLD